MQILNSDRNFGIWFTLQPASAFLAKDTGRVDQGDQRGSKLLHYDGSKWWVYPLDWKGLSSKHYLQYQHEFFDDDYQREIRSLSTPGVEFTAVFKDWGDRRSIVWEIHLQARNGCVDIAKPMPPDPNIQTAKDIPDLNETKLLSVASGLMEPIKPSQLQNYVVFKSYSGQINAWGINFRQVDFRDPPGYVYFYDGKGWHLVTRTLPMPANSSELLDTIAVDSEGGLWLSFYRGYLVRYKEREVCRWQRVDYEQIYGKPFAGPDGQMWWDTFLPAVSTWPLRTRYPMLRYHLRGFHESVILPQGVPEIADAIPDFFYQVPSEYMYIAVGEFVMQNFSMTTPFYFDGERFRHVAPLASEKLVGHELLERFNQSKKCWLIEDLNQGRVLPDKP
ncbi:MAG: hypothetical protein ACAI44_06900 [Candidatus Sericytochromatia bacterium]